MRLIFRRLMWIGVFAGKERLARAYATDPSPQISAIKFQASLLEGFSSHGVEIQMFSALPIVAFPRAKTLVVAPESFDTEFPGVSGKLMWDINLPIVRLITRFLASVMYGVKSLRSGNTQGIVVYPLHTPFLAAAVILKKLFKLPIFIFIPDLPTHTSGKPDTGLKAFAKSINDKLLKALVTRADLAFPFTDLAGREWLPPSVQYLVVEGIAPSAASAPVKAPRASGKRNIVYTGQFSQVSRFAQMFADNRDIAAQLIFVGEGPDGGDLSRLAQSDNRIQIKPFMTGEALQKEFEAADFLLNPRDPQWEGAKYSFPSKLHDYMARGRPVMSTRMPGIPAEYFDCFFEIDVSDSAAFAASLKQALDAPQVEIERRIAVGETMLATTKSPHAVVGRVLDAMSAATRGAAKS